MDRGRLVAELPMQEFKDGIKRLTVTITLHRIHGEYRCFTILARKSYQR